jgi:hypothetical protein
MELEIKQAEKPKYFLNLYRSSRCNSKCLARKIEEDETIQRNGVTYHLKVGDYDYCSYSTYISPAIDKFYFETKEIFERDWILVRENYVQI